MVDSKGWLSKKNLRGRCRTLLDFFLLDSQIALIWKKVNIAPHRDDRLRASQKAAVVRIDAHSWAPNIDFADFVVNTTFLFSPDLTVYWKLFSYFMR